MRVTRGVRTRLEGGVTVEQLALLGAVALGVLGSFSAIGTSVSDVLIGDGSTASSAPIDVGTSTASGHRDATGSAAAALGDPDLGSAAGASVFGGGGMGGDEPAGSAAPSYEESTISLLEAAADHFPALAHDGRITEDSLEEALESQDPLVRDIARALLDRDSLFDAADVGAGRGDVDGEISLDDLEGVLEEIDEEGLRTVLADTASGSGGNDDHLSEDDLRALAEDESVSAEIREWAAAELASGRHAEEDDCTGFSLCQLGDAADAIGLDSAGEFLWDTTGLDSAVNWAWDTSGLDSFVGTLLDDVFWRTIDNIQNGAGAWYEWPGDFLLDTFTAGPTVVGNLGNWLWDGLPFIVDGIGGRDLPHTTSAWRVPPGDTQLFVDGASPGDIMQGSLGSCVTLAAFGAVVAQNPELIENAIRDNGDGTYTVTFWEQRPPGQIWDREWESHEVTVDARVPVNSDGTPIYARPLEGELWPLILEKAWAQYRGGYHRINGDNGSGPLEAITGNTASFSNTALDRLADQLPGDNPRMPPFDKLVSWHEAGNAMIVGGNGHMQFIIRIDAETGMITVGNPWGASNTEVLTYDQLRERFPSMSSVSTDGD